MLATTRGTATTTAYPNSRARKAKVDLSRFFLAGAAGPGFARDGDWARRGCSVFRARVGVVRGRGRLFCEAGVRCNLETRFDGDVRWVRLDCAGSF